MNRTSFASVLILALFVGWLASPALAHGPTDCLPCPTIVVPIVDPAAAAAIAEARQAIAKAKE
jgi:hypothetical protein